MLGRGKATARAVLAFAALMLTLAPAAGAAASAGLPPIRHVFLIVLENKDYSQAFQLYSGSDPYLSQTLPSMGALIPYYFGTGHASADNYISMISGQPPTADTKADCVPAGPGNEVGPASDSYGVAQTNGCWYPAKFQTVADQLARAGLTWRGYVEGMQGNCSSAGIPGGKYAEKHNPFPYFGSLLDSGQCAANDVPLYPPADTGQAVAGSSLATDLQSVASTPNFSLIAPNLCNDGHDDCTNSSSAPESPQQIQDELAQIDAFLHKWVPAILASPAYKQDGMLVIASDEGGISPTGASSCCSEPTTDPDGTPPGGEGGSGVYSPGPGGGQVGAVALSPYVTPGTQSDRCYNHYSFLHTVEDLFGLPYLAEAAKDNSNQPGGVMSFGGDIFTNPGGATGAGGPSPATGPSCEITAPFGLTGP
jgi:phospholipase C